MLRTPFRTALPFGLSLPRPLPQASKGSPNIRAQAQEPRRWHLPVLSVRLISRELRGFPPCSTKRVNDYDLGSFYHRPEARKTSSRTRPAADRCCATLGRHVVRSESKYRLVRLGNLEVRRKKLFSFVTGHISHVTLRHIAQPRQAANTLRHIGNSGIHSKTCLFENISIHLLLPPQLQWPAIGIVLVMLRGLQCGSRVQAPRKSKIVYQNMTTKT
jgi:hypothetical protein